MKPLVHFSTIFLFASLGFMGGPTRGAPGDLDSLNANIVGSGASTYLLSTVVEPDGKIVMMGQFTSVLGSNRASLAALNANGTLDIAFQAPSPQFVSCMAVQKDGKVLIAGQGIPMRLNANGSVDTGFSAPQIGGGGNGIMAMAVQDDGKILLGGDITWMAGYPDWQVPQNLLRLNPDGSPDLTFKPDPDIFVSAIAVQPDGRILIGGSFFYIGNTPRNRIARLYPDGTLDSTFNRGVYGQVYAVALQPDGKVLFGGSFVASAPAGYISRNRVARFNADGTLDADFNPNIPGDDISVSALAIQTDGKILIGGRFTSLQPNGTPAPVQRYGIARVNPDGTLDSFDPHVIYNPTASGVIYSVGLQADGKVLLGGAFTSLQPNGQATAVSRQAFARLQNDPATMSLTVPNATSMLWQRGGAGPEISSVIFELSTDQGSNWTSLGGASRVGTTSNWQKTGLTLPAAGRLRARGLTGAAISKGGSLIEQTADFSSSPDADGDGLLDSWERSWWPTTTGHGPQDDDDHDGLNNLLELAFGLNPALADAAGMPAFVNEAGYLTITVSKKAGAAYEVQASDTMSPDSFSSAGTTVVIDNATTLKVRDSIPAGTAQRRLLRVKVTIGRVVAMNDPLVRRDWTPDFPGVTEAENCRDWKPGIPINQEIIREKDNVYWKELKTTPKLWLPLEKGQELWANRFGSLTSFRIPGKETAAEVSTKLAAALTPAEAGINVVAVKEMAGKAVSEGMDFGMLFVSMSAFLIGAALLLSALLFIFGIEQRAVQCGVLRAAGWTGKEVRGLFLREALWIAGPAAFAGAFAGLLNTKWTLAKLQGEWADAAVGTYLDITIRPLSIIMGAVATLVLAFGVVWWATRRLLKAQPRTLLGGAVSDAKGAKESRWVKWTKFVPVGVAAALAMAMLIFTPRVPQHIAPVLFFGAAFLLLVDGLRVLNWRLKKSGAAAAAAGVDSVWKLGVRNTTRRRGRSVALAALLALGIFMITALNAFRQDARLQENTRQSGAGGFTFVGESTLPVYEDLNTTAGQKAWDFDPAEVAGVKFVPFRVRDGEEASCLNLNRAQTPRVLGLSAAAMPSDAFSFAAETNSNAGWQELNNGGIHKPESGAIPAIMDQYSAMFALGKSKGDIITVPDSRGEPVKLQIVALLAGSVLQGNVIISEEHFVRLYPDTRGYRYFLVDVPAARAEKFRKLAVEQLSTRDFSLTPATDRLAQFQAVQNTYLTIFSTLGGLALLLSTIGLAVLVARHVMERRAEFATLTACGFRPGQLRLMVLAEHWFLFFAAIALGCGTAVIAVWPNLRLAGAGGIPLGTLAMILGGLLAGGMVFCAVAARLAITRRITTALRAE